MTAQIATGENIHMKQNCTLLAKLLSSVLIVLLAGQTLNGQSGRPADLNLAYDTAAQFWTLLTQRKRLEASRLIATEEQQSAFLGWAEPPYSQPVIEYIRFGSQRDRVVVSISVKTFGLNGLLFTRSLEQEWLYQGRRWVLNLDISENKLFTDKPLPTDDDKRLAEFKAGFRLKTTEIDIPEDAWGKTIPGEIEYEYTGPSDLVLDYVSGPDVVNVELADLQKLEPQGKIKYLITGRQLFSTEFQPLKVQVYVGKEQQEYVIPVRWSGKPPYRWTFSPSAIEPNYTGEVKLELFNQSEEVWTAGLASVTAPGGN